MADNREYDLLTEYLDEDPSILSEAQLQETADAFGLTLEAVKALAGGMSAARTEIRDQFEEEEAVVAGGWRDRWSFHLAGQHDQASHGAWAGNGSDVEPAMSAEMRKERDIITEELRAARAASGKPPYAENSLRGMAIKEHQKRIAEREAGGSAKVEAPKAPRQESEKLRKAKEAAKAAHEALLKEAGINETELQRMKKVLAEQEAAAKANAEKHKVISAFDADEEYEGMDAMGISKRNTARQALRREEAVRLLPSLARFGDSLILKDMSWDRNGAQASDQTQYVLRHLEDLAALPDHMVAEFVEKGGTVYVGNSDITRLHPDLKHLRGIRPRGWPAGTGYEQVAGVFNPQSSSVVLGNIPGARYKPVSNFAFHEFGHGMDQLRKKVSLLSQEDSFASLHSEFKTDAKAHYGLNNYYVQQGNPGAGASEFFADGTRAWAKARLLARGLDRNGETLTPEGVVRNSFAEAGTYVSTETAKKILDYFDAKYNHGESGRKPALEREPEVRAKRAYVKKKKMSVKDVTFSEEARARSLRNSGKTIQEISDQLKISVGTLNRILGGS